MADRTQNLADIKTRITSFMRIKGPCLPIHISKETKSTLLLASAFLSDLASEKTIKISSMKVGGSPLYYLPGQEGMLENFQNFLNHKEREAFLLLKNNKILSDDEQDPAIRVALRNLKDFAVPYTIKFQDKQLVFWQFHSAQEQEVQGLISQKLEETVQNQIMKEIKPSHPQPPKTLIKLEEEPVKTHAIEPKKIEIQPLKQETKPEIKQEIKEPEVKVTVTEVQETKPEITITEQEDNKKIEPIFPQTQPQPEPEIKPKPLKPKREKPKPDRFLQEVKKHLESNNILLEKVEKFDKKEVTGKIKLENGRVLFLLAIDKKRVEEFDLLRAHKKAIALSIPYLILTKGESPKKLSESIEAYKNLEKIEKIG
jgi:hypothetical protein